MLYEEYMDRLLTCQLTKTSRLTDKSTHPMAHSPTATVNLLTSQLANSSCKFETTHWLGNTLTTKINLPNC